LVLKDNKKLILVVFTRYCAVDQIEKNEMGGECGTYGGEYTGFWWGKLSEREKLPSREIEVTRHI